MLSVVANNDHEAIWLKLTEAARLLTSIPCIILCNLYPPKENDQDLIDYLYETLTTIESRFANCVIIILGDFNKLNLSRIKKTVLNCIRSSNFQLVVLVPFLPI